MLQEIMIPIEQAVISELPAMPPPSFQPIFLVVSYYVGPGCTSKTWKVHKHEFLAADAATLYANQLSDHHLHRRIVKIG